ncbi:unnamed protein product [Soboliphyme baturini]|uniref:Dipeptidyl peptidase 4 n=1 Tax=Soboliphyme baturini TaxID=241478 RepID=A0A183J560_9BILA|nr:unnamed protein product [Soboliphyme baturini]
MWWSKSGKYLAYLTLNDTLVDNISLTYYPEKAVYPVIVSFPYSKVGTPIPTVTVNVWNKQSGQTTQLRPPDELTNEADGYYVLRVSWVNTASNEEVFVAWANRVQNLVYLTTCSVDTGNCAKNFQQNYTDYWAQPSSFDLTQGAASEYFLLLPEEQDGNFFSHVSALPPSTRKTDSPTFLTNGAFEVNKIVGYNKESEKLVSMAKNEKGVSMCLTCDLKKKCGYVNVYFSPAGTYYMLECRGPGIPYSDVVVTATQKSVFTIENNDRLHEYMKHKKMPLVRFQEIPLNDNYKAIVKYVLPHDFYESSSVKHPLILKVYAGPDSQAVTDTWLFRSKQSAFEASMTSERKYAVVYIDGRGSANRGSKYLKPVYKNLGVHETEDQINAFKKILSNENFSKTDTAVWGWSYGGFSTGKIAEMDGFKTFKCASSVAPVTYFVYYGKS